VILLFAGQARLHRVVASDALAVRPDDRIEKRRNPILGSPLGQELAVDLKANRFGRLCNFHFGAREVRREHERAACGGEQDEMKRMKERHNVSD
jgi:hypothetical protein